MITVDEVRCWTVLHGIGHVVATEGDGFIRTACDWLISGDKDNTRASTPQRICRRCRERLTHAIPVKP